MLTKKKHEKKKWQKLKNQQFLFYYYDHSYKTEKDVKVLVKIEKEYFKKLFLPSAFKVEEKFDLQGPSTSIYYSKNLFIENIKILCSLNFVSFKWKKRWYSRNIVFFLDDYKLSFLPQNLICCVLKARFNFVWLCKVGTLIGKSQE